MTDPAVKREEAREFLVDLEKFCEEMVKVDVENPVSEKTRITFKQKIPVAINRIGSHKTLSLRHHIRHNRGMRTFDHKNWGARLATEKSVRGFVRKRKEKIDKNFYVNYFD